MLPGIAEQRICVPSVFQKPHMEWNPRRSREFTACLYVSPAAVFVQMILYKK